jgi:hypothetical protein
MAFDGPSPFDGDPAYDYLHVIEGVPPEDVRSVLVDAFEVVLDPDAEYLEIDETVWAWAAAELVAVALGRPSDPPPPEPFASAARGIPDAAALIERALAALDVVADEERSEIAELWLDRDEGSLDAHLMPLRERLRAR